MSSSVGKLVAERNHRILVELVTKPGNDICADCKARAPRWASHNLGIFICVSCASIHRKIGTHITKVKSITLDEWSKEQVEVMKENGNIKSNALYNPDEARHPPPTNMIDSERDSELEKFIRSKYEFKRFMTRKSGHTQYLMTNPGAVSKVPRPRSTPLTDPSQIERKSSPGPPLPPKTPENLPSRLRSLATIPSQNATPTRSFSQPLPLLTNSEKLTTASPLKQPAATQPSIEKPAGQVWDDLISLQGPSQSSSLPLQYSPSIPSQPHVPVQQRSAAPGSVPNPFMNLSLGQANATTPLIASQMSVSTPGPQFSFVSSAPLPSPALHLGVTNPFNHAPFAPNATSTAFSTGPNPFSSSSMSMSMATSTSTTPSMQPVVPLPTGIMLHTPSHPYMTSHMSTPVPAVSFPNTPFASGAVTSGLAQNPFAPVGPPGQMPLATGGATNPFSTMQMGQAGFPGTSPHAGFATTAFLNQQQQRQQHLGPNGFGGWAAHGAQGTF